MVHNFHNWSAITSHFFNCNSKDRNYGLLSDNFHNRWAQSLIPWPSNTPFPPIKSGKITNFKIMLPTEDKNIYGIASKFLETCIYKSPSLNSKSLNQLKHALKPSFLSKWNTVLENSHIVMPQFLKFLLSFKTPLSPPQ